MPKGVSCSVSNCAFWNKGNRCGAEEIAIEVDGHAFRHFNEEFAADWAETHHDTASQSSVTCCLTFRPADGAR